MEEGPFMRKDWSFLAIVVAVSTWQLVPSYGQLDLPARMRSPVAAAAFFDLACQLRYTPGLGKAQADVALALLQAAMELDPDTTAYYGMAIELASRYAGGDYAKEVGQWLGRYISPSAQFAVCRLGIDYVLGRLSTSKEREQFLQGLLESSAGRNAVVDSYLLTQYGILLLERKNGPAAKALFTKAYQIDPANRVAFAQLIGLAPDAVEPGGYLEHLRLVMQQDPLDMDTAMAFSQYAEQLELYDLAAGGYGYCAGLFCYLHPDKPVPAEIYLPWVLCLYQTEHRQDVIQIANKLRDQGVVDLFLESVAAKAAARSGEGELAERILSDAEQMALRLAGGDQQAATQAGLRPRHVAWFYSFVKPDKAKALDWANKAYAQEPNSPITVALLAYALAVNGQAQYASSLLDQAASTQIGQLAGAIVLMSGSDKAKAANALRSAIAKDPGSLVAEVARGHLTELGYTYRPRVESAPILERLSGRFGQTLTPRFADPNQWIGFQVAVPSNTIRFGESLVASVMVSNQGLETLVVGDGWISGLVCVDVNVTGDLQRSWPEMIATQAFSYTRLAPGRTARSQVLLTTGPLEALLDASPQAALRLQFTVRMVEAPGQKAGVRVPPVTLTINRPAVELTAEGLKDRHQRLARADLTEAIATSRLFVGLVKEQHAMVTGAIRYRFRFSEWLPQMLRDALLKEPGLLTSQDPKAWELKVHTLAYLSGLDMDLDIARAAGECLSDQAWPVRLMAMYILARQDGGFQQVLRWAARYDLHPLVRQTAGLLAGPQVP